jgi:hypothetical protein
MNYHSLLENLVEQRPCLMYFGYQPSFVTPSLTKYFPETEILT